MQFKPEQIIAIKPLDDSPAGDNLVLSAYSPLLPDVSVSFSEVSECPQLQAALSDRSCLVVGQKIKEMCSWWHRAGFCPKSRLLDIDILQRLDPMTPRPYPKAPTPRDLYFHAPWYISRLSDKREALYRHLVEGVFPLISSLENLPLTDPEGKEVYSLYSIGETGSGRIYSSGERGFSPQLIKKTERNGYRPPPGLKFVIADQKNMELRILAQLSEDPSLIGFFENDIDIHQTVAEFLSSRGANGSVPRDPRQLAKAVNFLIIFGGTPYGLAQKTGMTEAQAEKFMNAFFSAFPYIEEWGLKVKISALERGYIETEFGRIRIFNRKADLDSELRSIQNFCVQSFAADVNTLIFRAVHHLLPQGAKVMIMLHDSIVLGCRPECQSECMDILKNCFENPPGLSLFRIELRVPLKVKLSVSDNWI